ncbi:MAG: S8 family peptidase [Taibaiella sp.]|nr:S8 family peptidase [Taibaiella sp.]
MKPIYATICFGFLLTSAAFGQQNSRAKLSPRTKLYLHEIQKNNSAKQPGYIYNTGADGVMYLSSLVKVSDPVTAQSTLDAVGAKVGTKAGRIWTVKVPVGQVSSFIASPGISYIQLDEPVRAHLDQARKTTKVDSVHGGYNLPHAYSGKDVVVGIIDFGFDYNHPTFYDTNHVSYRIKKVWQMNGTASPPAGYTFGKELTTEATIKAEGTDDPKQNHGTSVAGMAAGSGYGSAPTNSRRFRGMAYDADMVMVCVRRDSIGGQWMEGSFSDFLDGVKYCFDYATSVSKPCVVNISWGSQSGAHDGTSLFNEAVDTLSGPGRIVVMSAGNEGEEKIHLSKTFTATDTTIHTFLTFNPSNYRRTWVDIWGEPGKTFCAQTTLYSGGVAGNTTGYQCINDLANDTFLISANGLDTCFVQFITSSAEDNGKPRTTINLYNKSTDTIGISIKSTSGKIDVWNEYYYYGFPYRFQSAFDSLGKPWAVTGNTASTVSDMGSGNKVLLVGAYTSKSGWKDINGRSWNYSAPLNRLTPFSSRGPMVDGRIKPDITAPGLTIATSVSSYDTSHTETGTNSSGTVLKYTDPTTSKNYYYAEFAGTSASAPAASGIIALLLQANPSLTPASLFSTLFETAIEDIYTGDLPPAGNNDWGHGKINAYAAMKRIAGTTSTYEFTGSKIDCTLFPNPSTGSFVLDYNSKSKDLATVVVYSITGTLVHSENWNVSPGFNRLAVSLPNAAAGMYMVKLIAKDGTATIKTMVR